MFYKKTGYPEENEIVFCTVKKILPNTVFVSLDEYQDKEGIIHISEIAPGRIRSIREYVREGKKIFCKVLRVNQYRNAIELSLRRVSPIQITQKNTAIQLEQRAEKLLEVFSKKKNTTLPDMYSNLGKKLIDHYGSINASFTETLEQGSSSLIKIGIDKDLAKEWSSLVQSSIKLPEVRITRNFSLQSPSSDGIKKIRSCFTSIKEFVAEKKYSAEFHYLSAPRYSFSVKAKNYKAANSIIEEIISTLTSTAKKAKVDLVFEEAKKHHAN